MQFVINHSYLIPLLPLLGAIVAGLFGAKGLKQQSHWPVWLGVGAAAVMSLTLLAGMLGSRGHVVDGSPGSGAPQARLNAGASEAEAESYQKFSATHWIDVQSHSSHWFDWIVAGDDPGAKFNASAGALIDPLTAVMLSVVCGIGFLPSSPPGT